LNLQEGTELKPMTLLAMVQLLAHQDPK